MIKQLKSFTINLVAGANVATILLMVLSAYSDRTQRNIPYCRSWAWPSPYS